MDLMNSRFKQFGASFGSKRSSNRNVSSSQNPSSLIPAPTNGVSHTPTASTSSTTSLPMNPPQNGLGRPPSYTYNPQLRSTSPLPPATQQTMTHHPPPINTSAYAPGHPALGGAAQPPGYGGAYPQPNGMHSAPQPTLGQYGGASRGQQAVEVEGAGRSKAQLIVGIDFVRRRPHGEPKIVTNVSRRERRFPESHLRSQPTRRRRRISSRNGRALETKRSKR